MARIALIVHEHRDDAAESASALGQWADERGHSVVTLDETRAAATLRPIEPDVRGPNEFAQDTDLVVSLGGDGSMLGAVQMAARHDVAVLGVNFGQMGYLAAVEPNEMVVAVEAFFAGRATIESRMRVAVTIHRADGSVEDGGHALNEALVERDQSGRTIRLGLSLDDSFFTTYNADGVIIASPTGATAYSLSAGGPIVAPMHEALIVTPVSPHQLFDRSLVVDANSSIDVELLPDRAASLSVDGREVARLEPGDRVVCTKSDTPAKIVSLHETSFLQVLKAKFGLNDR